MDIEALIEQIENTDWLSQAEHILAIFQLQIEWETIPAAQRTNRATYFLEQCKACKLK